MPREELYGLTSQMRRSAVSIPSNIAEGQGRRTDGEFVNLLSVAHGSIRELETQLMLSSRLQFVPSGVTQPVLEQCAEVGRLVNGLMNSIST
jgi:four helix bundle protein